jgi:carbon-monoxide dehydrogenase large subunit
VDYDGLRKEQTALRARGIHRGIGLATFIEITNPSAAFYAVGGARISSQDGCTIRLNPQGGVIAAIGVTEQGQGTEAVIAQVVATAMGVPLADVRVVTGDTDATGKALRQNVLAAAAVLLQADASALDIRDGRIVDARSDEA